MAKNKKQPEKVTNPAGRTQDVTGRKNMPAGSEKRADQGPK